jgi:Tol biopolymer transport system component
LTLSPDEVRFVGVRDWSPDGKLLAVRITRMDGALQIAVATVADGSSHVLKSFGWNGPGSLFFSRDSRYIAFDAAANDDTLDRDVFVVAVDGSRQVGAVVHVADDRVMGWSPDGRFLLFSSDRTGSRSLWAQPFAQGLPDGPPQLVKSDIGTGSSLGLTDQGALYYYKEVSSRDVKVSRVDLNEGRLLGQPQGLLPAPTVPRWSPDGRAVVYQPRETESLAIRLLETGEVRRLPRRLAYHRDPQWSPDGRSLLVGATDSRGRFGVFRIDAQSGQPTLIVRTNNAGASPRWSADGTKIYYRDGAQRIIERNLATGTERAAFTTSARPQSFEISPDGRNLAVQVRQADAPVSSLQLVPLTTGQPRELLRLPDSEAVNANLGMILVWTPDSRGLMTAKKAGATNELWLVDVETGRTRRLDIDTRDWALADETGPPAGFSLSPDGGSIAFLTGTSATEVWALENVVPALPR